MERGITDYELSAVPVLNIVLIDLYETAYKLILTGEFVAADMIGKVKESSAVWLRSVLERDNIGTMAITEGEAT